MIHATPGATIGPPSHPPSSRVAELLRQYFRIAFLMGRPQDLPGGPAQLRIGVTLAFLTYLIALTGNFGLARSLLHVLLDLGCTALALWVALSLVGHPGRFEQAFGGLCGASAFVNAAAVPIYLGRAPAVEGGAPSLAEFVLLVWSLSLLGHVLRHAFELRLGTGIGLAFVYVLAMTALMDALLPVARPDEAERRERLEPLSATRLPAPPHGAGEVPGSAIIVNHVTDFTASSAQCPPSDDIEPSPRAPSPRPTIRT